VKKAPNPSSPASCVPKGSDPFGKARACASDRCARKSGVAGESSRTLNDPAGAASTPPSVKPSGAMASISTQRFWKKPPTPPVSPSR
jgi:hypothetical protein